MKTAVEYLVEQLFPKALSEEQYYHIEQAKEMEKEQKILIVQQLKNYTYDSQCILGNDDREASEFVDIFDNETFKQQEQ
jgi:Icc-related predicted phosphoesterase